MALGKINFADLARLLWKSNEHFGPMQQYLIDYMKEHANAHFNPGIVSGCELTAVAGLTVRVAAGLVLFDNGELALVAQQDINLNAADPANPRKDRIELIYSLANNTTVTNIDNQVKQFDKVHTSTATKNTGVAAGAPVLPAKTGGSISVGSVSVAAAQVVLGANDLDTREPVRDLARELRRFQGSAVISNNQAAFVDVKGLQLDKTRHRAVWVRYHLVRSDDTPTELSASGILLCRYKPITDTWQLTDISGDEDGAGVDFQIGADGQIQYESSNMAGANPVGTLTWDIDVLDI